MKVQRFFNSPLLKKDQVITLFKEFDEKLNEILVLIEENTDFLPRQFMGFYASLATGDARFRAFYKKKNRSRVGMAKRMRKGFITEDKRFLLDNYFIVDALYKKKPVIHTKFNRYVRYTILENFLHFVKDYKEQSFKVANGNYSFCQELHSIESTVRTQNATTLYGVINQVESLHQELLDIRNKIIEPYLRYVFKLAAQHARCETHKEENFQVGVQGLMKGVLVYEPETSSFGNYIKYWINQNIISEIYENSFIKIPKFNWEQYSRIEKVRNNTQIKDLDDLAKKSGVSKVQINDIYERVTMSQVQSLDQILSDNPDADFLAEEVKEGHNLDFLSELNEDEKLIFAVMFSQPQIVKCNIHEDVIEKELIRQAA